MGVGAWVEAEALAPVPVPVEEPVLVKGRLPVELPSWPETSSPSPCSPCACVTASPPSYWPSRWAPDTRPALTGPLRR